MDYTSQVKIIWTLDEHYLAHLGISRTGRDI